MEYPILLVHGIGFRDFRRLNYWGRIPSELKKRGYSVHLSMQDSFGTIENNAIALALRVDELLAHTGAEKVNIIAHSKGGIDARCMACMPGMSKKIASLTTIAAPHHGSAVPEQFRGLPRVLAELIFLPLNLLFWVLGDELPDFVAAVCELDRDNMKRFNEQYPDPPEIYCQSFGVCMNKPFADIFMLPTHLLLNRLEGANDGIISVRSSRWTNFRGIVKSSSGMGFSHCDAVNMRRFYLGLRAERGFPNICGLYIYICHDLEKRGF